MQKTPFHKIKKNLSESIPNYLISYLPKKWEKIGDVLIIKIEKWLMRYANLPFGASIIVLADKTTRADCNSIQGQGN